MNADKENQGDSVLLILIRSKKNVRGSPKNILLKGLFIKRQTFQFVYKTVFPNKMSQNTITLRFNYKRTP